MKNKSLWTFALALCALWMVGPSAVVYGQAAFQEVAASTTPPAVDVCVVEEWRITENDDVCEIIVGKGERLTVEASVWLMVEHFTVAAGGEVCLKPGAVLSVLHSATLDGTVTIERCAANVPGKLFVRHGALQALGPYASFDVSGVLDLSDYTAYDDTLVQLLEATDFRPGSRFFMRGDVAVGLMRTMADANELIPDIIALMREAGGIPGHITDAQVLAVAYDFHLIFFRSSQAPIGAAFWSRCSWTYIEATFLLYDQRIWASRPPLQPPSPGFGGVTRPNPIRGPALLPPLETTSPQAPALSPLQPQTPPPAPLLPEAPVPTPTPLPPPVAPLLFTPVPPLFDDVASDAWYHAHVRTVASRGLFNGTAPGVFDAHAPMTRAMFVQVLANLESAPQRAGTARFADVQADAWYFPAVEWAASQGVVQGMGNGHFDPHAPVTRAQMAVILHNYLRTQSLALPSAAAADFADQANIAPWATDAVRTLQSAGIMAGRPGNIFDPTAAATRAEVATVFSMLLAIDTVLN